MKFGVREICDVVFRAKANQKIGNKMFYKDEPVIYFDSLKTSTLEGAATTVYAQGGRGNARLIAWEGERTLTFTMEDALISPVGFAILSGAGLVDGKAKAINVHTTETIGKKDDINPGWEVSGEGITFDLTGVNIVGKDSVYVMIMKDGEIISEPFSGAAKEGLDLEGQTVTITGTLDDGSSVSGLDKDCVILADYYVAKTSGAQQIEITADKFGGNYYVEASTLFRDTNGVDMPAEFVIPNAKIQSNFTFTLASTGDPSTFTFTMDAFPDCTRFDKTKKVMALIQIIGADAETETGRQKTDSEAATVSE